MIVSPLIKCRSLRSKLRAFARNSTGVAIAATVLLLSAPFVNLEADEEIMPPPAQAEARAPAESRLAVKLRHGDTLMAVLKRYGIPRPSAHALIAQVRPFVNPRKMQSGDNLHVVLNSEDRTVEAVELTVDDNLVRVKATHDGWLPERQEIPFVREAKVIRGTIKGSLYESGVDAGLSPQHIIDLAKIFESDIDFFSDFQPQDSFSVVIEELRYSDGRRVPGRILAAELEANKDSFDAFYFTGKSGNADYYNNKGEAIRRAFLRAPLSYSRISSPYSTNRRHPIFRTLRPHLAIDYAAPAGSPVVAIGPGRVDFAGWRGGYGNVVDIRHAGNYISRYAHFSKLAGKLRKGQTVEAGEVIGYVGQTGHATGPHLHFEFLRGGTKVNFLDLRIPKTQQLAKEDLRQFQQLRDERQAMLRENTDPVVTAVSKSL